MIPTTALMTDDFNACTWWRIVAPFNALRARGYPAWYGRADDPATIKHAQQSRVMIYPRQIWQDLEVGRRSFEAAHESGQLVFAEYDDDMWVARREQKPQSDLTHGEQEDFSLEQSRASIQLYDGVVVTTERLRTTIHSFAPDLPVEVVPNAIDLGYWRTVLPDRRAVRHPELRAGLTIGWAGGDRYDRDLEPLAEAWAELARRHKRLRFVVMGHQPAVLCNAVPEDRLHQIQWMPIEPGGDTPPYPVGLAQIDISCCSVAPTRFNAAKTPIKAMEATASGSTVVASQWLYGRIIEDGRNGLIAEHDAGSWLAQLERVVKSHKLRRALRRAAERDLVEQWSLEANLWRWPAAWAELARQSIDKIRPALEAQHAA